MTKRANGNFVKADQDAALRLIGASYGEQKVGKTSFWLSAPGPIYVQSFDYGLEGVIQKFQREKDIYVREYDWAPGQLEDQDDWETLRTEARSIRDTFLADFEIALKNGRTIVWDKETEVWELFRYAEFGGPSDAPKDYPKLNQRYRYHLRRPYERGLNFGLIQGLKDKWVSKADKRTGEMKPHFTGDRVRSGFGEIGPLVQIDMWHTRERGKFYINVGGCRQNAELQDQTFEGLSFPEIAQLVFPDSSFKDWE